MTNISKQKDQRINSLSKIMTIYCERIRILKGNSEITIKNLTIELQKIIGQRNIIYEEKTKLEVENKILANKLAAKIEKINHLADIISDQKKIHAAICRLIGKKMKI